jgi:hypothetical protein
MLKRDTLYYLKLEKNICVTDNNGGMFEYKFNDCVAIVAEGEDNPVKMEKHLNCIFENIKDKIKENW